MAGTATSACKLIPPSRTQIVALNLTRAVQICVDIAAVIISGSALPAPDTMGEAFDALAELTVIDETLAGQMVGAAARTWDSVMMLVLRGRIGRALHAGANLSL